MSDYSSHFYFFDLLSLCLLLVPVFFLLKMERAKRILMILSGIYLLYFVAPRLVLFNILYWIVVYFIHKHAFKEKPQAPHALAILLMPLLILPLVFWKTTDFGFIYFYNLLGNLPLHFISTGLWEIDLSYKFIAPIGLSFMTFRAIDLIVKTYVGKITDLSFDRVMFYGFFPPVQVVGPIIEYEEIEKIPNKPLPNDIIEGCARIAVGFIKVFILGAALSSTPEIFRAPQNYETWELWVMTFGYSWYVYFNFSGYSDVAIGVSRLYGFKLKENFSFPFFKKNIQEFWNSWHMSLSRWAQRNIFIPAGGYRAKTQKRALFLTMMTIALWHDISLGMTIFGIYHFAALAIHREYAAKAPKKDSKVMIAFYMLLTYVVASVTFPFQLLKPQEIAPFYLSLVGL